ncbi:hypothetical protein BC567DRAFT_92364 [Phyllosticta citribraziliensis]
MIKLLSLLSLLAQRLLPQSKVLGYHRARKRDRSTCPKTRKPNAGLNNRGCVASGKPEMQVKRDEEIPESQQVQI